MEVNPLEQTPNQDETPDVSIEPAVNTEAITDVVPVVAPKGKGKAKSSAVVPPVATEKLPPNVTIVNGCKVVSH